ncbi:MAG: hypothetical protein ACRDPA_02530 [Solirubrobacteraceae bacterium]
MHDYGLVQDWVAFATVAGAAAASLTGLLFVAVSIRIDVIAPSPELRNRAAQTLLLFGTVVVISIVLAIPSQAYGPLGAELIAVGVMAGAGMLALDHRARSGADGSGVETIGHVLDVIAPNSVTSVLVLVSGALIAAGVHAGLYVLVVPIIAALVGGVASAWLLLTRTGA